VCIGEFYFGMVGLTGLTVVESREDEALERVCYRILDIDNGLDGHES
jgi:hypothetical protein